MGQDQKPSTRPRSSTILYASICALPSPSPAAPLKLPPAPTAAGRVPTGAAGRRGCSPGGEGEGAVDVEPAAVDPAEAGAFAELAALAPVEEAGGEGDAAGLVVDASVFAAIDAEAEPGGALGGGGEGGRVGLAGVGVVGGDEIVVGAAGVGAVARAHEGLGGRRQGVAAEVGAAAGCLGEFATAQTGHARLVARASAEGPGGGGRRARRPDLSRFGGERGPR